MDIESVGLSHGFVQRFKKLGYSTLYPTQIEALKTEFLNGKNLILAVPTAAGKTLIAYLAIAKCLENGKKAVYIVPLKALAEEKYEEMKSLGMNVILSIGDYDSGNTWLKNYDVVVCTSEKCDSLLRHEKDFFDDVSLIVVDEIHLVDSIRRGPTMEVVISKMKNKQIIALSATISNAEEMAVWLNADLVVSEWRPVELKEGVFYDNKIEYSDGTVNEVFPFGDETTALVADGLKDDGQVLVFVNSRRSTQSVARKIAPFLKKRSVRCDTTGISNSNLGEKLMECMQYGVAFHHAGLDRGDRKLIEQKFKNRELKVIIATPTLAAGINLPARRVIVRDWRRFDSNLGYCPISNLEVKQMMGRAGRPKYDKTGEAILLAKKESQKEGLFKNYICAKAERITSKLSSEIALRSHLLSLCVPENSIEGIKKFFTKTFFAHQFGVESVNAKIETGLAFLKEHKLIEGEETLRATKFGKRVCELYIDPLSGVILNSAINEKMPAFGMLHTICHTPDMDTFYLRKREYENYDLLTFEMKDDFLLNIPDPWYEPAEYEFFLSEVKTAAILLDWINEIAEREICEKYDIGPGDLARTKEVAEWLAYSFREIAKISGHDWGPANVLMLRLKHGIKEELLDLTSVRGIGRVRARKLHNLNIKKRGDLRKAPLQKLERILGKKIALNVKKELGIQVSEKKEKNVESNFRLE
ncbi:MAG: DEAD/DEAH box helicase [Candidatus Methanofastidiosia archaeon]